MKNLNAEMIAKAKTATSAEELLELAKADGIELTAEEAKTYFAQLKPQSGELDDDELDAVAGGGICSNVADEGKTVRVTSGQTCSKCGGTVGTVKIYTYTGTCIYCDTCGLLIAKTDECTYEVL